MTSESHEVTPNTLSGMDSDIDETASDLFNAYLQSREAKRVEFDEARIPTSESEQFTTEMTDPIHVEDLETGMNYGVYKINRDAPGLPLIINMAWSEAAGVLPGRKDLKAYATHINRPIFVIDTEGRGETDVPNRTQRKELTFDDIAAAHLRIIDGLEIDEFDIVGRSMGGVIAAKMAEQAGERVGTLVTISTVGFEEMKFRELANGFFIKGSANLKDYINDAPEAIRDESGGASPFTLKNTPTLLKLTKLMTDKVVPDAVEKLSPSTHWCDVVGSKEEVTDWKDHLETVRRRNAQLPGSSSEHILGSEFHSWGVHANAVALSVASVLKRQEEKAAEKTRVAEQKRLEDEAREAVLRASEDI